jgi:DNA-binding response OmpR family regulator
VNILLVDDDSDFAESMAEVLRLDDHAVVAAESGEAALDLCARRSFDLAFLDAQLPGASGLETISTLRRSKNATPFYLITGHGVECILDAAVGGRCWRRIPKKFDEEILLDEFARLGSKGMLFVPRDPFDGERLRTALGKTGRAVHLARTRGEAYEADAAEAVVLDMPATLLEGLEIYLERADRKQTKPIVFLTPFAAPDFDSWSVDRQFAATGILTKPFPPAVLLDWLKTRS